ncbi:hypothetical protein [uncultured Draconibacterium sp.]|uniref:hypothetical protein n=1 Tax=uncultured Draconibacterium sp. TaxID=1573823 RepID=UPI0029C6ADC6|nr:hypothetical protein [uncultured Draconibacterium sp.]
MKNSLKFLTLCFIASIFVCCQQSDAFIKEKGNEVTLENQRLQIIYDLENGSYDVLDKKNGKTIIADAIYEIAGMKSSALEYKHTYTSKVVTDSLGSGITLIIHSVGEKNTNELLYEITLYRNEGFFTLNWGLKNNGDNSFQLKNSKILVTEAYHNYHFNNYYVLDGESSEFQTHVDDTTNLICKNNLLVTFGEKGQEKNSLVIGGLTYNEFEKYAQAEKLDDRLKLALWAEDPVGKKIDPGTSFISSDKFFVNFSIDNRFDLLEDYGKKLTVANNVDISGVDFPILNFWYAYVDKYGGDEFKNNSTGTLEMLKEANKTGFGKYSRIGIRLEPDDYAEPNNQQGWWDDEHWQEYKGGQLLEPLETMKKWGNAIVEEGGVPLIYFQTSRRSEDYALAYPGHMLFNESHKLRPNDGNRMGGWWNGGNKYWGYDFTDPGFIQHMQEVYAYLKESKIKGVKFDYPLTGWSYEGGFEDPYATTSWAYRNIFKLAYEGLGKGCDIHERLGRSDITLGVITTNRTENDNDIVIPPMVSKTGLRWYKNRVVYHCDQDARNPFRAHPRPLNRYAWQSMYTMTYVTSGRMEIGKYFHKMEDEMLYDLSRVTPLHQQAKSARPIDAFSGKKYPEIYDFEVNEDWHLLTFYNTKWSGKEWPKSLKERAEDLPGEMLPATIEVELSAATDDGGLGLAASNEYYIWDYWNNNFIGKQKGNTNLSQELKAGEARMMAIHKVKKHPQFISTNRHIMQGYVDMTQKPVWDESKKVLAGASKVPENEDYKIVMASNGFDPEDVIVSDGTAKWEWINQDQGIFEVVIRSQYSGEIKWQVEF